MRGDLVLFEESVQERLNPVIGGAQVFGEQLSVVQKVAHQVVRNLEDNRWPRPRTDRLPECGKLQVDMFEPPPLARLIQLFSSVHTLLPHRAPSGLRGAGRPVGGYTARAHP